MSKKTVIWIITASALVLVGCMIFGGLMTMLNWNFSKLSTTKYETNTHKITEDFTDIRIVTDTADIEFIPSDEAECRVVCYEATNAKHAVSVEEGALNIKLNDTRKWYEHIGISFGGTPKITLYVPNGEYGSLTVTLSTGDVKTAKELSFNIIDICASTGDIKNFSSASEGISIVTTTGNINVENVSAASLSLSVSTGKVTASSVNCEGDINLNVSTGKAHFTDIKCKSFISDGSTGDLILENVIASEAFSIERSTGDIRLDSCDASELKLETSTGDVVGTLCSDKVFIANTDTGNVDLPQTTTGGKCEITTSTGDIEIEIK